MSLPPYVNQGGEQVFAQPFLCENALFYGMILMADEAALQANVCDKLFNIPMGQPGRFVPAGPFVLLAMCKLDKLVSETEPFSSFGGFTEQEVAFWVLTVDTVQDQVYFAFPYIWVDNAYALSMGREIYGFPKQLGKFQIPSDVKNAEFFSLDSLAIQTLSPDSMGSWLRLLEAKKTGELNELQEFGSAADAVEKIVKGSHDLGGWDVDLKVVFKMIADLFEHDVPFVFLKQFRDVADGTKACYQSVIECICKMQKWHGGGLLDGTFEVTIPDVESQPMAADMGLGPSPIVPGIAFWCDFDFYIGEGQEIWRA